MEAIWISRAPRLPSVSRLSPPKSSGSPILRIKGTLYGTSFSAALGKRFTGQTLSSILVACEVAVRSDDVPPLQNYADSIFAFRERISPGEITRRIHVEEWHRYCHAKEGVADNPSQMDDMFTRLRNEIGAMEQRSKEFKGMVDELVRLVDDMQERERIGGFVNGLPRGPRRVPAASRSSLIHSSSVLPTTPTLADSRARLPPHPAPTSRSPLRTVQHSHSPSHSHSQALPQAAAPDSPADPPLHAPPPPRPAQNPRRRLFNRVFYAPRSSEASLSWTSGPNRTPSPPNAHVAPAASSSRDRDGQQAHSEIAETRARLPPPPQTSPVPYRPPGQRLFSFFNCP